MYVLLGIALKSVIIAGATLGLLALMKHRSAAERSWIAHIGLLALLMLAFAPLALPNWTVEAPSLLGQAPAAQAPAAAAAPVSAAPAASSAPVAATVAPDSPGISLSATAVATAAYALPAAVLLLITFLALARLITLRARADVLVDGHWLSALARAQRRMGFKHGTALLTSDDLASPISWGLMRPVILLNSRAVEAAGEAEAIISHELAHVARLDWIKLLLARVATALFWFNPFVWMLAREAHQLREEAADDAVLAANIVDTDYAQLLVGVARHECSGLLLGAHGVAPSKSSLARRVARVLDGASARGPVARSFAMGVFVGAMLIAAPLAALTLTPGGLDDFKQSGSASAAAAGTDPATPYYPERDVPTDLASIIADGVSTSVATAVAAVGPTSLEGELAARESAIEAAARTREAALETAAEAREAALEAAAHARETALERRVGAKALHRQDEAIKRAIEMKAVGVTPDYVAAMRAAAPSLARVDPSEFVALRALGVTPEYARQMAAARPNVTVDELTEARAVGVTGEYIRAMAAAGVRTSMDKYVELRAVGVSPTYVQKLRSAGYVFRGNVDQLIEMQALGISPRQLKALPPPAPPAPPRVPPPDWDPIKNPDYDPDDG